MGIQIFKDSYALIVIGLYVVVMSLLLIYNLFKFIGKNDILSPGIILPCIFVSVMVIGSFGNEDISVIYISKIDNFKWQYYILAMISYFIGVFVASKNKFICVKRDWDPRNALMPIAIIFIFASVATFIYFSFKGGIPLFSKDINVSRFKPLHGIVNILPYFNRLLFVVSLISFIAVYRLKESERIKKYVYWCVIASSAIVLTLGGGRQFVQIAFLGVVVYHYVKRPLKFKRLATFFVIMITVFSIFGYIRTRSTIGAKTIETQLARIEYPEILPSWTAPPYIYCRIITEIFHLTLYKVPKELDYQKGKFTFGDFLTFLPGKRSRPDYIFTDEILEGDTSTSGGTALSFMTSFYLDFGLSGIILGFLSVGYLLQRAYIKVVSCNSSKSLAIYCLLLYYSVLGIYGNALFTPIAVWEFLSIILFDSFLANFSHTFAKRDSQ